MAIDVVAAAHRTARRSRDIAMDFDCRLRLPRAPERMDKKDGRGIYVSARDEGYEHPCTLTLMRHLPMV